MLTNPEIMARIRACKNELLKFGVTKIGLFGSSVRGEANEKSDIDILIDFDSDKETYDNFMKTCSLLELTFKEEKIDIVSAKGLSPFIGPHILKEVKYA